MRRRLTLWVLASLAPGVGLAFGGCGSTSSSSSSNEAPHGDESSSGSSGQGVFLPSSDGSEEGNGSSSGGSSSGGSSSGGPTGNPLDASLDEFCAGGGGIPLPSVDGGASECAGDIANRVFNFAICACDNLTFNNALRTESIDSRQDAGLTSAGASVGVNGTFGANNVVDVSGSLWSKGNATASNGALEISFDWISGGNISSAGGSVARDVRLAGSLSTSGSGLTIGGNLRMPAGQSAPSGYAAIRQDEAVSVNAPCNCDTPVDVGSIVAALTQTNDNTTRDVSPSALSGNSFDVSLDCGRYYFDSLSSTGTATLRLRGRTVVAIAGNVTIANDFSIQLDPMAELDLFIGGNVTFNGAPSIGDPSRPFATRIYVAGTSVTSAGKLDVAANIYAPYAHLQLNNAVELRGAMFAKSFTFAGATKVTYDEAILDTQGCNEPARKCASCSDCGNPTPACKGDGTCGPCTSDAQCCAPLVCNVSSGRCIQPAIVK